MGYAATQGETSNSNNQAQWLCLFSAEAAADSDPGSEIVEGKFLSYEAIF